MSDTPLPPDHAANTHRVVILNGFSNDEIVAVMRAVKGLCRPGPTAAHR